MKDIRKKLEGKTSKLAAVPRREEEHPAKLYNYQDGSFYNVEIDDIIPNPHQPRKFFDPTALEELSQSIKQKGVLQPVIIRMEQDKIYLVAGERRFRAAKKAGLKQIPAILTTGNPAEIALIENIQREDLKPIEEAEALDQMIKEYSYTQENLAAVVGKARSTITETLSLNKLPDKIKEECRRADNYPRRLLVEIAKQETQEKMISLFNQVKEGNLNSGQVREITRKTTNRPAVDIFLERIASLNKNINSFDLKTISESKKMQIVMELQNLKTAIEKIIS